MQKSDSNFRSHSVYSCVVSFIPFGTLFRAIAFPWSRKLCHHNKMTLCRCSPINREFYHAKGTEKFILGRYLLSGILLILLSLRPWGVAARPAILENRGKITFLRLFHYPCEITLSCNSLHFLLFMFFCQINNFVVTACRNREYLLFLYFLFFSTPPQR
jgi:hypothetical protein